MIEILLGITSGITLGILLLICVKRWGKND